MPSYEQLREEFPEFIYNGYNIEEKEEYLYISYDFEIPGLSVFKPQWKFKKGKRCAAADSGLFRNMVFSLGLVELISYWKITCPGKVIIKCGYLSEKQKEWWKNLYFNGLGEFYHVNGIEASQDDFMDIYTEGDCEKIENTELTDQGLSGDGGILIPVGGGKDSAVSLSVLEPVKERNYCYIINPRGATKATCEVAGYGEEKIIVAQRTLDKNMLRLNKEGYLNGHTPFSAIVAFSATIAAYLNGLTYIVLSNESSANESTVMGSTVNHQYSKSFKFEKDFHDYEKEYIKSGTYYFSLLRPLSEFQIAMLFSGYEKYHDVFKSCNVGSKEDIWCGHCPKCLFVWLIMSPFISQKRLAKIFGRNMADDREMLTYFKQLIGLTPEKPFECVGSRDEINAAITLTIRDFNKQESGNSCEKMPYLFEFYKETGLYHKNLDRCERFLDYFDNENLIPSEFMNMLKESLKGRPVKC